MNTYFNHFTKLLLCHERSFTHYVALNNIVFLFILPLATLDLVVSLSNNSSIVLSALPSTMGSTSFGFLSLRDIDFLTSRFLMVEPLTSNPTSFATILVSVLFSTLNV